MQKILKKIDSFLLSLGLKLKENKMQNSYYDKYGAVVMVKIRYNKIVLSFARGNKLANKFPKLKGNAKIVRYLEFNNIDDINKKELKEMIKESYILGIEAYERKF